MTGPASGVVCVARAAWLSIVRSCGAVVGIVGISIFACAEERPAPRMARLVVAQPALVIQGTVGVSMNGMHVSLHVGDADVPPEEDDGSPADDGAAPAHWQTIRFEENSFDQAMFAGDREAALRKLEEMLASKMKVIDRITALTDDQKQKLLLAGRGHINHLIQRIDSQRSQFELVKTVRTDNIRGALRELMKALQPAAKLRTLLTAGPFDSDSLFEKTLRRLVSAEVYNQILDERKRTAGEPNVNIKVVPRVLPAAAR